MPHTNLTNREKNVHIVASRSFRERIVVDSEDVEKKIKDFVKILMPRTKNKVELYEEGIPLFHK